MSKQDQYAAADRSFLHRCADLAMLASGEVGNSPRVGAVLVHDGRIIGEGYHRRAGQAHAEVNCLAGVRPADRPLISAATLYVSLEPCCIAGRSGACTGVIKRAGIPTVVFGQRDATPGVDGRSVRVLREAGVTVREYPDFEPTRAVGAHRRTMVLHDRPYVILKYARSADGFLRPADRKQAYWITNDISRRLVHRWRAETAAILVGARTVVEDDPALTTRLFPGPSPQPVILDPRQRLSGNERVFTTALTPLLFTCAPRPQNSNATVFPTLPDLSKEALTRVLRKVLEQGYGSVLVEGGAGVLNALLAAGLWDEARVFTGAVRFGTGVPAPTLPAGARVVRREDIGEDLLETILSE